MNSTPPILPIEAVATYPLPGMAIPGAVRFSPDDTKISYLHSAAGSLSRQLYQFDIENSPLYKLNFMSWKQIKTLRIL